MGLDAETHQPIPNATVFMIDENRPNRQPSTGQTDDNGRVRLSYEFMAGGISSPVQDTGVIILGYGTLQVEGKGYQRFSEQLVRFIGERWKLHGPPLPDIEVGLKRESRP
jgi:hypothetical protein